jgi:pyridoxal phosphate enzyme (YggS family)
MQGVELTASSFSFRAMALGRFSGRSWFASFRAANSTVSGPAMHETVVNLRHVLADIAEAARDAGRSPDDIGLVAVSKTHDAEHIRPVLEAGHRLFGENRVQEAAGKWPDLRAEFPDARLHLIGPLQTNKVRHALELFDVIETVDRPKLAREIAKEARKLGKSPDCFIQVNTGAEPQKAGVLPQEADAFIESCRDEFGLSVKGLMCIPPVDEEPSLHFALLREIAHRNGLSGLSMGMSGDYQVAIAFGATLVRVGTAIFGARQPYPAD